MMKQMKDLCIKADQGSSLAECLNKYTKPQIRKILDFHGVKVASAAKKQEMADAAETAVRESAASYFETGEETADRALLEALTAKPLRLETPEDFNKIENLYKKGIIFLREEEGAAETILPSDIAEIFRSTPEKKEAENSRETEEETSPARVPKEAVKERSEREAEDDPGCRSPGEC